MGGLLASAQAHKLNADDVSNMSVREVNTLAQKLREEGGKLRSHATELNDEDELTPQDRANIMKAKARQLEKQKRREENNRKSKRA